VPFFLPQLHLLSFVAAVPFFYIIFKEQKKIVKYSVFFAMSFYLSVYIWFLWMYPMEQVGVTPFESLLIVTAAWIGFPILQTFCFLILPFGLKLIKTKNFSKKFEKYMFMLPVLCASLYVIVEWVQSWFLSGLTWAKLAVSQYRDLFFIQSMSVFGTYFPAFIIIFINAAIALYILNRKNQKNEKNSKSINPNNPNNANILILACILLYFGNISFGLLRLNLYDICHADYEKITAQVVQGNISSYEKWEGRGVENSLNIFRDLTEQYNILDIHKADICVWPETTIPTTVIPGNDFYADLKSIAEKNNITLLTGAFYSEISDMTAGERKNYNAIMAFDKNTGFVQPYAKQHLVPFGEYLPFENILTDLFPFITNIALFNSRLTPGGSSNLMQINGVNYGGLVCFDSIFPELARKSVKDGADILIIVTNDSWFRDSSAIYQHNAQAVLRAVQNNRYVVRSANTGISSFISPTGRILQQSEVFERTVLTQEVGLVRGKTIYTLFGDIILYFALGYVIFCVIMKIKSGII
jgi:apolipoprotein N-acyltransferase